MEERKYKAWLKRRSAFRKMRKGLPSFLLRERKLELLQLILADFVFYKSRIQTISQTLNILRFYKRVGVFQ